MVAGTVGATLVVARTVALTRQDAGTAEGHILLAGDRKGRPYNEARTVARTVARVRSPCTEE